MKQLNDYAEQLGYKSDLDLLFDFLSQEDVQQLCVEMLDNAAVEVEHLVNEWVEYTVEKNPNLKDEVKKEE